MNCDEIWKPILGFQGRYEVSNKGRVRSLQYRGHEKVNVMKASKNYAGYHVVTLGKERKQYRVHCLVLEAFVGARPDGMQGCHNDSDKNNNALSNLRWDTPKGNASDREDICGEKNPNARLSNEKAAEIRLRRLNGETCTSLAKEFNVTPTRVCQIAKEDV